MAGDEMSERFERWRARNSIQTDFGGLAVLIGVFAFLGGILGPILSFIVPERVSVPHPWISVAIGVLLIGCAIGLWQARIWARWAAVVLCAASILGGGLSALFGACAAYYLLSPSVAKRFARAQGLRESSTE